MKRMIYLLLACMIYEASADNSLDAFQSSNSDKLVMSIRDDGTLFRFEEDSWEVLGEPCPGAGPFTLHLMEKEDSENVALIFVIDSSGKLFQTNGEWWIELIASPDSTSNYSQSSIFRVSGTVLQLVLLDDAGNVFINNSDDGWFSPFDVFPATPPRAMSFHYDEATNTFNPFIIGADGRLYGYFNGDWQSSTTPESDWNIQNVEIYIDTETNGTFMVAFDDSGRMYTNAAGDGSVLTNHEPCPGVAPWDIKLLYIGEGNFDLLCLDSNGMLSLATVFSWTTLADSFEPFPIVSE